MKRRFISGVCALLISWHGSTAFAQQSSTDIALAEELYREGSALMDQKQYEEACRKLAESHRLDPATGTLMNLASCHEAMGLTATAWVEYGESLLAARRDQRPDRVQFNEQRIAALEPKLSRLAILVPKEAQIEGLEVRIDGKLIGAAAWGVSAPIDPGKHRIEALAPRRIAWSAEVSIGAEADKQSVQVPLLEEDPNAPQPELGPAPVTPLPQPGPPEADRLPMDRPIPTSVYIAGGITLAFAAAAGVSGAMYLSKRSEYDDSRSTLPEDQQQELRDSAQLPGIINLAATGATVVGAVVTGYLYFSRPTAAASTKLQLSPWVGVNTGGLIVGGTL
jgi:hypothetical protein